MPDLLLELRSEEIPARMQRKAAGDLRKMVTDGLVEAGLTYEAATEYWTPRRLALDVRGLTARSKDVSEEIKGPSTKAPPQAVEGFLRKAGLSDVSQAHVHSDPKKGDFYVAHISKPGRDAEDIIAELVPAVVRSFPWPKSMRWGKASAKPGSLRWVRPLQSILCTFGPETSDPVVVDFEVDGIRSGNVTFGHRFHAPEAIEVRRFDDYVSKLMAAKVVLDAERRKRMILDDAKNLAFASGLELVEDEGLLEEVSGLVEWPVVLMGEFEQAFLDIPAEIIRLTIRANQKCFVARPSGEGEKLANRFILTANIEAKDGGAEIARGNGKVVRARLSDAVHFWKTDQADLPDLDLLKPSAEKFGLDLAKPLDQRMARLDHLGVTFHAKLGTQGERVERIARLAEELAPIVGADPVLARRAAVLAKADLPTEVVGEFPELQGAMGRKYALLQGEDPAVAAAIEEHYKPQGPSDHVPTDPVAIAVALADKLDTLVGFWTIDEKPTGSRDPFALRRAALGVIRIVVENGVRLRVGNAIWVSVLTYLMHNNQSLSYEARQFFNKPTSNAGHFPEQYVHELLENGIIGGFARILGVPLYAEILADHLTEKLDDSEVVEDLELDDARAVLSALISPRSRGGLGKRAIIDEFRRPVVASSDSQVARRVAHKVASSLLVFFFERLKVYLRERGARHDTVDAVLESSLAGVAPQIPNYLDVASLRILEADDLLLVVSRVAALGIFLDTEDGRNLLAGTKRAANILAAEEKKGTAVAAEVNSKLLKDPAERALFSAINEAESEAAQAIVLQDFAGAMTALAKLRAPIDAFFDAVMVNDDDPEIRANRLALLARIRAATGQVADFSKISG